jgi:hypothetical protein
MVFGELLGNWRCRHELERARPLPEAQGVLGHRQARSAVAQFGVYRSERLAPAYRAEARERARRIAPILTELRCAGLSARKMAAELMARAGDRAAGAGTAAGRLTRGMVAPRYLRPWREGTTREAKTPVPMQQGSCGCRYAPVGFEQGERAVIRSSVVPRLGDQRAAALFYYFIGGDNERLRQGQASALAILRFMISSTAGPVGPGASRL